MTNGCLSACTDKQAESLRFNVRDDDAVDPVNVSLRFNVPDDEDVDLVKVSRRFNVPDEDVDPVSVSRRFRVETLLSRRLTEGDRSRRRVTDDDLNEPC